MAKKNGPYVGVTGFMSRNEVLEALTMVPKKSARRLMVGVLMSSKTLAGQTNKWPGRYPKKEAVANIFVDDKRALNLVHYNTDNPETLFAQLTEITKLAGPHLDGFQLNIAWPPISQIQEYRKANPEKFLLLQIGGKAMAHAGSARHLAELVGTYLPAIDAILIDPSGGKGQPLDPTKGAMYLFPLRDYPELGLGIAGGLGSQSLYLIEPLVKLFPNLSIDAEGQLRTPQPEDKLCVYTMKDYLEDAFQILAGVELPGMKLRKYHEPYGFKEHLHEYGSGANMLRTKRLAQPCALQVGDILATGEEVLSIPRDGFNGTVMIHIGSKTYGCWIGVPSRIPVALLTKEDRAPANLRKIHK